MHIGQGADISRRLQNARWTDSTHQTKVFPDNVDALMADFVAAQAAEDEVYVLSQASEFTKQRLEKDAQRDALYKEIKRTVDTFATLSIFPDKQAAALVMQPLMQKYNIQPDGGTAPRIVSTDKKAVKAGGLYLALNGVAVNPTDDVDAEKEYQLISTDSSSDGEVTPVRPE